MRKSILVLAAALLAAALPVFAQDDESIPPASLLPADVPLYAEVDISDGGVGKIQQLLDFLYVLSTSPQQRSPHPNLTAELNASLSMVYGAGFSFEELVLPWAGAEMGIAAYPMLNAYGDLQIENYVIVLPIAGDSGLAELEERIAASTGSAVVYGSPRVYAVPGGVSAFTDQALYLGTEAGVQNALDTSSGTLANDPGFAAVAAALPDESLVWGYMNAALPMMAVNQLDDPNAMGGVSLSVLVQAIFAIHPAVSAVEEGLLAAQGLNGLGFALQMDENVVDVTGVLSFDAAYSQPSFTSERAGAALLQYVPGTALAVIDSYDIVIGVTPVILGSPVTAFGNVFDEIVYTLETGVTPTPLSTPTPLPLMSAQDIAAQVQPVIEQIEMFLGVSLEELYALTNGEYAIAIVPTGAARSTDSYGWTVLSGSPAGVAAYLQTPDSAQLIQVVRQALNIALPGLMRIPLQTETETIGGIEVTFFGLRSSTRVAYGALNETTLFLATEDVLDQVLAAANGELPTLPETRLFPSETIAGYGDTAMMYYVDLGKLSAVVETSPYAYTPPLVVTGGLVIGADGLFTGYMTLTLKS